MNSYFVVQILRRNGTFSNNVHVKENVNAAMHQYCAFLSTYAFEQDGSVDYAACYVIAPGGGVIEWKVDDRTNQDSPEGE